MVIINKNGEFNVSAAQFNYLTHTFVFDEIDSELVVKTNFINSTWEYEKADKNFKNNVDYHNKLK